MTFDLDILNLIGSISDVDKHCGKVWWPLV